MSVTLQLHQAHTVLPHADLCDDCWKPRSIICENGMVDVWLLSVSDKNCQVLLKML